MPKMITALLVGFIGIIMFYNLFLRESAKDFQNQHLNEKLQNFINSGSHGQTASLKNFTDFEWDSFCIYSPYSIPEKKHFIVPEYTLTSSVPDLGSDERWAILFKNSKTKNAFFIKLRVGLSTEQYEHYNATKQDCFDYNAIVTLVVDNGNRDAVGRKKIKFNPLLSNGE